MTSPVDFFGRRPQPNFFLIGAPKAASTSLWHSLRQHPEVFMPSVKEPRFFCLSPASAAAWADYASLFEGAQGFLAVGEASPDYSKVSSFPEVPQKISSTFPTARILYIVRNPLDRIVSAFLQCRYTYRPISPDFGRAVREYPPLIESTLYWKTIQAYRQHFSDDRIQVLFFEDFVQHSRRELQRCFDFLGVDAKWHPEVKVESVNLSADRLYSADSLFVWLSGPTARRLSKLAPAHFRRAIRKVVSRKEIARPKWDPWTLEYVLDRVGEDARRVLEYADRPRDFWPLERRAKLPVDGS